MLTNESVSLHSTHVRNITFLLSSLATMHYELFPQSRLLRCMKNNYQRFLVRILCRKTGKIKIARHLANNFILVSWKTSDRHCDKSCQVWTKYFFSNVPTKIGTNGWSEQRIYYPSIIKKRENIVYIYFHNNCDYQLTRRMPSTDDSRNTPVTEIDKCFYLFWIIYNGFFISDKRIIIDDIVITINTFIMAIIHYCCLTYFRVASYYFYTWIIIRLFVNKYILLWPDRVDYVFDQGTCNELL